MIAVFDLDGTLANIDHRRHLVENGNNKWDDFYQMCPMDSPNIVVCELCKILKKQGYQIAILSGRMDTVRTGTKRWLADNHIKYDFLYMRPEGNYSPDQDLKREWIKKVNKMGMIFCIFDDRTKVVDMWREEGYTCLQVAKGDF